MSAELESLVVGVLGTGAMGSALLRGWLATGLLQPGQIVAYDALPDKPRQLARELGIGVAPTAGEAVQAAGVVLLAVKPQDVERAIREAFGREAPRTTMMLSIAAGVPLARLEALLGERPVVRAMPNTPALVQAGASAYARGHHATAEHGELARALLSAVGLAYEVKEALLNAVTGLSGSGPAYVYLIIEALADGGVRCGLPRDVAQALAAQTVLGAAKMVIETGEHPGQLKDRVASPGGTTIAGLATLETRGLRGALIEAVTAATRRAEELG